ncbi:hypothetical protein GCM10023203_37800 [Actinomycetospora straminea]|uniref:Uncharacterized protein n=1 Tax=Actinomycetospora straminea TaxID=663607 RepID=A0ABP9EMC9_9PSEU
MWRVDVASRSRGGEPVKRSRESVHVVDLKHIRERFNDLLARTQGGRGRAPTEDAGSRGLAVRPTSSCSSLGSDRDRISQRDLTAHGVLGARLAAARLSRLT